MSKLKKSKPDEPNGQNDLILVIVESPGKISKIQHILGDKYIVMACVGHIMDLDKKKMSINFEGGSFQPIYSIIDGKENIVKKLKNAHKQSSDVLIATDEDREGEMIAWCLAEQLQLKNPKRIVFNSITKKELLDAVKNPKQIDSNLVDAQKMRRMLDRIIGYKLTPLLWKSMGSHQQSTGRVQGVVVRRIVEQENKIKEFFSQESVSYFKTSGEFTNDKTSLIAHLYTSKEQECDELYDGDENENCDDVGDKPKKKQKQKNIISKISDEKDTKKVMEKITKSEFKVSDIIEKESIRQPSPPFTTSTLQQEASRKFGFTTKRTMMSAQRLYEAGYITYMRTDSVNLSDEALKKIGDFVIDKYGEEYHRKMNYKSKIKNSQEAHEAIRPTDPKTLGVNENINSKISFDEIKLYTLIWKRAVASQMSSAKFKIMNIKIDISHLDDYYFVSTLEKNIFLGYLMVYNLKNDKNEVDENDSIEDDTKVDSDMKAPKKGTVLNAKSVESIQEYKRPPIRFNEASLVRELEKLGIGRPSTYATTIDKIQNSNYVKKENVDGFEKESMIIKWNGTIKDKKLSLDIKTKNVFVGKEINKFIPSATGCLATTFLVKHFPDIMQYEFTADMENKIDDIAKGNIKSTQVLSNFWKKFDPLINDINNKIKTKEIVDEKSRELGKHPKTGDKIVATIAKYGAVVKMYKDESPDKCVYAPIKEPLKLETITLDEAIELFEFPKKLGRHENKIVMLNRGKYGYYITIGNIKTALKITNDEVDNFKLEDAINAIKEKTSNQLWKGEDSKNTYVILNGPYGKYINVKPKKGKNIKSKNCKLPDDTDVEKLTVTKVCDIVSKSYTSKKKFVKKTNNIEIGEADNNNNVEEKKIDEKPKKKVTAP